MDIAENSVAACAKNIQMIARANTLKDRLYLAVIDDGNGMDAEMAATVIDPFVTSRTTRKVGLGIPLLKAAAEACEGWLVVKSAPGEGTQIMVEFCYSHIDRMPMGDLPSTWLALLVSYPAIHWTFKYSINDDCYDFDDQDIKEALGDISLTEPDILAFLRSTLQEGFQEINAIHTY